MSEFELVAGLVSDLGVVAAILYAWYQCQREKAAAEERHRAFVAEMLALMRERLREERGK